MDRLDLQLYTPLYIWLDTDSGVVGADLGTDTGYFYQTAFGRHENKGTAYNGALSAVSRVDGGNFTAMLCGHCFLLDCRLMN